MERTEDLNPPPYFYFAMSKVNNPIFAVFSSNFGCFVHSILHNTVPVHARAHNTFRFYPPPGHHVFLFVQ